MKIIKSILILFTFYSIIFILTVFAQEKSNDKISGLLFGDYYYKAAGVQKDFQAFQIRRLYFGYDHTFNESFVGHILFEGTDKSLTGEGKYGTFIKTAFVEWKNILPNSSLNLGLIPTPTWILSEKLWNYRSVEKTISDLRGVGGGSDLGVSLKGALDEEGKYNYFVMVGNGNGQKPESNKYKKYYFEFNTKLSKDIIFEIYTDYDQLGPAENKLLLKGIAGYQSSNFSFGVEALQQIYKKPNSNNTTPIGISAFTSGKFSENLNLFARFDLFDPNSNNSNDGYKENFIVAGLDFMPIKDVHFMPNIWINTYSEKNALLDKKDTDVLVRITFFYLFR